MCPGCIESLSTGERIKTLPDGEGGNFRLDSNSYTYTPLQEGAKRSDGTQEWKGVSLSKKTFGGPESTQSEVTYQVSPRRPGPISISDDLQFMWREE